MILRQPARTALDPRTGACARFSATSFSNRGHPLGDSNDHALLSNVTVVARIGDTFCSGKKTAKQVPLRRGCVLLRTRIQPSCLSNNPLQMLSGVLYLLGRSTGLGEAERQHLATAHTELERT